MRIKQGVITCILIFSMIMGAIYLFSGHIAVYALSGMYGLDISYKNLKSAAFKKLDFNELTASDAKRGLGLYTKDARVNMRLLSVIPFKTSFDFYLKDVRFTTNRKESAPAYDDLVGLISAPFKGQWVYREIHGQIEPIKGGVRLSKFMAVSDDIRISIDGDIYDTNIIRADLTIYFSKEITGKIPDELSGVVLSDEPDGWKSLSAQLSGNYGSPAIQLSSKLFRLNIKALNR